MLTRITVTSPIDGYYGIYAVDEISFDDDATWISFTADNGRKVHTANADVLSVEFR